MLTQSSIIKSRTKGFTLIELMLATSLLMMVMFSGYYAYSLYSQKWQKRVQNFWQETEQAVALDTLNKLVTSALPYIVNCKDDKACIYFKGNNSSVSFVTNAAIYSDGPALIELSLSPVDNEGKSQLVYRELGIADSLLLNLDQNIQWQHEAILLTDISDFSFSYFGWSSYQDAVNKINSEVFSQQDTRLWYQSHSADDSRILPNKIQITFTANQGTTNFEVALSQHGIYRLISYLRVEV